MFVGIIFGLGSYYVSLLRDQTLKFVGFFNFLYTSNSSYMRDRHPFYLKAPATFVPKQQLLVCGIIFLYIYDCEQWPNTIVITCGYHCTICCRKIKSSKVKKNMILFLYFNIWHYWKNTLYWLFYCGKWAWV